MDDREPPHDLAVEAAVLSAVMVDESAIDKIADVTAPEHFYSESHRRTYEAIIELRTTGRPIDIAQVGTRLRENGRLQQVGGMAYLTELLDRAPAVANVRSYAETVLGLWRVRCAILEAQRIVATGYVNHGEPTEFVSKAAEAMHAIAHQSAATTIEPVSVSVKSRFRELMSAGSNGSGMTGIHTGFDRLDRMMGGLQRGDLNILAARPSVGKSALALAIAINVASAGYAVAFFSLEMARAQLVDRILGMEANIDVSRIRTGTMSPTDWQRLSPASIKINELPLWIDDRPGISTLELAAKSRRVQSEELKKGRKLGLIVTDYLQLMRPSEHARRMNSREREVSEVAEHLKGLSISLDVPVLALSQLNRQSEQGDGRKPRLSDLRESGALEQHANNVLFIHRERDPAKDDGTAEIIVAKQRNGPTGTVIVRFSSQHTRFENLDEGDHRHESAA